MRLFAKKPASPDEVFDQLDKLVDRVRSERSEEKKRKTVEKINAILSGIDDVAFLNKVYEKEPYRNEETKYLVLQRYLMILGGITDVRALQEMTKLSAQRFSGNASRRLEALIGGMDDEEMLKHIADEANGFDFRARAIATLSLTHGEMSTDELIRIVQGNTFHGNSSFVLMKKAVGCIDDEAALKAVAFDRTGMPEGMLCAQIRLAQISGDVEALQTIFAQADDFFADQRYAQLAATAKTFAQQRLGELGVKA